MLQRLTITVKYIFGYDALRGDSLATDPTGQFVSRDRSLMLRAAVDESDWVTCSVRTHSETLEM